MRTKIDDLFREPTVKHITFDDIREKIFSTMMLEKDFLICITGDEGEGKSLNAAWNIGKRFWPDFDITDNVVYTGSEEEFEHKYEKVNHNGIFIIDEAIKLAYKMDFATAKAKTLVKKYTADVRKEKKACHILCIPCLSDLILNFRTHRVKMWIELIDRRYTKENFCIGLVFVKERNPFTETRSDPWYLKDFGRLWHSKLKLGELSSLKEKLKLLRSHPFYFGEITFPKPNDSQIKKYLLSQKIAKKKYELDMEGNKIPTLTKLWKTRLKLLVRYLKKNPTDLSINKIGEITKMDASAVSHLTCDDVKITKDGERVYT
ncbi:MAG: hypothetical protein U9Q97_01125 [Acidobacteriota bacterium]|nr:hypothetical protein [Acidobacteriota bacterium]